jgi:hypothetical protein
VPATSRSRTVAGVIYEIDFSFKSHWVCLVANCGGAGRKLPDGSFGFLSLSLLLPVLVRKGKGMAWAVTSARHGPGCLFR